MSDNIKEAMTTMLDELTDDFDDSPTYEADSGLIRRDVRRKIEDLLERKRLREELGDMDLDW